MTGDADTLAASGRLRTIEYAVCANGSMPAKEFVESLDIKNQIIVSALFQRMADFGEIRNKQKFRHEDGKIYAFKPTDQIRIACYQLADRWRLTSGFVKKRNKWPKTELKKANRIMLEDRERESSD